MLCAACQGIRQRLLAARGDLVEVTQGASDSDATLDPRAAETLRRFEFGPPGRCWSFGPGLAGAGASPAGPDALQSSRRPPAAPATSHTRLSHSLRRYAARRLLSCDAALELAGKVHEPRDPKHVYTRALALTATAGILALPAQSPPAGHWQPAGGLHPGTLDA